ncbi:hypothetical protein [Pseudoalteromonas sp.]|uniref:hypothetical protein n=1 Tax=Pseudoalteromonas sp. TaxID=53249 RepID=UPI0035C6FB06
MELFVKYIEKFLELVLIFQPLIVACIAFLALKVSRKAQIHNESMTLIELKREIRKLYLETISYQEKNYKTYLIALNECKDIQKRIVINISNEIFNKFNQSVDKLEETSSFSKKILDGTIKNFEGYIIKYEKSLNIDSGSNLLFAVEETAITNNAHLEATQKNTKDVFKNIEEVKNILDDVIKD